MKITKIHINGFGKLHNYDLEPGTGINVVFGRNEAGKSTLHFFIRSMLYGASTKKRAGTKSIYERMRPWHEPSVYGGWIEIEHENERYIIERDFNKSADDIRVYPAERGPAAQIGDTDTFMRTVLNDLSETAYVNTVSSGQLSSATEKNMAAELRRYAANISSTVNPDLNADTAIEYLNIEKQRLQAQLEPEAAREYTTVLSQIKDIEEELALPENENKLNLFREAAKQAKKDSELISEQISSNSEVIGSYKSRLKEQGFDSGAEIDSVSNWIKRDYTEYVELGKKASSGLRMALIIVLIILAIASAALAFISDGGVFRYLFIADAAACVIIAIIMVVGRASTKKQMQQLGTDISSALAPYIGSEKAVNEETMRSFDEHIVEARKTTGDIAAANQKQDELNSEMQKINSEHALYLDNLAAQQETKEKIDAKLAELAALKKRAEVLRKNIKTNKTVRENIDAIELAQETLEELAESVKSAAGTFINKEASAMVKGITGGAYDSISAGSNYDIQLYSADGMISVNDVSAGTADQVYLAIRLAAIRFIAGQNDPVPLILDDSFNLYDDERLAKAATFLAENYRGQMLIFTCQNREEMALRSVNVPYTRINM